MVQIFFIPLNAAVPCSVLELTSALELSSNNDAHQDGTDVSNEFFIHKNVLTYSLENEV